MEFHFDSAELACAGSATADTKEERAQKMGIIMGNHIFDRDVA